MSEFPKYDIICFKISEGTAYKDTYAKTFYTEAKRLGKEVWGYHFANGSSSPMDQAAYFQTLCMTQGIQLDKRVIDIEVDSQYQYFGTYTKYFDVCYTMGSRYDQAKQAGWVDSKLWAADYGSGTYKGTEGKYPNALAWQYTSSPYDKSVVYLSDTVATTIEGVDEMEFLFKAENGKDIYYHVAGKTVKVENPDYLTAIKAVYQQLNGAQIKEFDWTGNATSKVFINQFK